MTGQYKISQEIMWQVTIDNNSEYDGLFYYAVQTTGIFCRPSCNSRVPKRENVSFFSTADAAQQEGFRPCKRCRPDLDILNYDPILPVIEETKLIIKEYFHQRLLLDDLAAKVGVSRFHLNRLFKERTGETPRSYLEKVRVKQAEKLLFTTTLNSTDIAFKIGYQSLSSFYSAFKRRTGLTPRQYQTKFRSLANHK